MNPLTLIDLSANAFRILGLTAAASQAQVDAAARKMRIWQDPAMIPGTANDAAWIGPVARTRRDIENAVARLADPRSRIEEQLWWFCQTPPASDVPARSDPLGIAAFHDSALVHLYHSLLTNAADEDPNAWRGMIERFQILATSDDYLQWLIEVESAGDFEKRATMEEIASAQQQLPLRISIAVMGSVNHALASGDFAGAAKAIQLAGTNTSRGAVANPADALIDRMEDDLATRCNELVGRIDIAWKTRRVAALRPACNHAISRFGTVIRPLIDQLVSTTTDVDSHNRAKMHGVDLLIHVSEAYGAIENFMASQRTLETAMELAANTPMESRIVSLLDQTEPAALRQRQGSPRGQRQPTPDRPAYKIVAGGPVQGESWLSAIPLRYVLWVVVALSGFGRLGCSLNHGSSTPPNAIPIYDSSHPPPFAH